MFRFILEFIAFLLFFAAVRTVLTWVVKMFVQQQSAGKRQSSGAGRFTQRRSSGEVLQSAGELRKDPVCGTFVPVSSAVKRTVNGETLYFCSTECRDRYPAVAQV